MSRSLPIRALIAAPLLLLALSAPASAAGNGHSQQITIESWSWGPPGTGKTLTAALLGKP